MEKLDNSSSMVANTDRRKLTCTSDKALDSKNKKQFMHKSEFSTLGLINDGGTCWFNTAIQYLHKSHIFKNLLLSIDEIISKSTPHLCAGKDLLHQQLIHLFDLMDKPYENGVTALRISKHRVAIIRIILAYCPEYKEDLPWRNSSEAGDASKLLRGIIKTLEKEILEEFIATLPKHHQRKLGFLKTNPQNPLNTLYKNLNTLYQEIDKNLEREGLIWLISQQESPKCDLTRLQKISDLHRCFCKSLYCFQELTPTCLQCGVSLGSEKKLGKDVIRPNLSLELSFPDHVPSHKCEYVPVITGIAKTAKVDNFQVVVRFPDTISQYDHFVDSDSNFLHMQAAMIICTTAIAEIKHSMAVVRKNIDTVLLINDDVIRECHPTSWKELEQSIKDFLKNPLFRISVNFRCIACVMFESAY